MTKQPMTSTPSMQNSRQALELFRKAAKVSTRKATASPAAARELLVKEGIYTKAGKLTKHYRD